MHKIHWSSPQHIHNFAPRENDWETHFNCKHFLHPSQCKRNIRCGISSYIYGTNRTTIHNTNPNVLHFPTATSPRLLPLPHHAWQNLKDHPTTKQYDRNVTQPLSVISRCPILHTTTSGFRSKLHMKMLIKSFARWTMLLITVLLTYVSIYMQYWISYCRTNSL